MKKNEKIGGYYLCFTCGKRLFAQICTPKSGKVKRIEPLCKVEYRTNKNYIFCEECAKKWDKEYTF